MRSWAKMKLVAAAVCVAAAFVAARQAAAAEPAAPGVTILDDNTYWRWIGVVKPTVVEAEPGAAALSDLEGKTVEPAALKKMDQEVPARWTGVEFDDAAWPRTQGRALAGLAFYYVPRAQLGGGAFCDVRAFRSAGLHCLRAKFQVTAPAAVRELSLSLKYRGGVVVYLNGQEVSRASLPQGPLAAATPGASYPREAYVDAAGKVLERTGRGDKDVLERIASRDRVLGPVALPVKLLRQGVNVLAVEVHRSDFAPGAPKYGTLQYGIGVFHDWSWAPSWVGNLRLAAVGGGITPNVARPAGVQVWSQDRNDRASSEDFADPSENDRTIRLTGARNGVFSGKVVVTSDKALGAVKAEIGELQRAGGKERLPASAARVQYAPPVHQVPVEGEAARQGASLWVMRLYTNQVIGGAGMAPTSPWIEPLSETPPAQVDPPGSQPGVGAGAEVWLSVRVPKEAAAGDYSGTLAISVAGAKVADVPVHLHVADWTLPDPSAFRTFVGIYQSPTDLALHYKVPEWSEEHWKLMERSMALLGGLGAGMVQFPVIDKTRLGNEDGMVTWIRKEDGTFDHDFSAVERYLKMVRKHLGTPKFVIPYLRYAGGYQVKPREEVSVPVLDRKSGQREHMTVSVAGTPEDRKLWEPLYRGLKERLAKEGMEKALCLGSYNDWRPPGPPRGVFLMLDDNFGAKVPWISYHHPGGTARGEPSIFTYVPPLPDPDGPVVPVHEVPANRWCALPYYRTYQREARPLLGARLMAAHSLLIGFPGMGHLGLDYWRQPGSFEYLYGRWPADRIYPGMVDPPYLVWPGPEGVEAMASYEAMREGIQEAEAMKAVSEALFTGEARLGAELAERCHQVLRDELAFCTFRDQYQFQRVYFSTNHYGWQGLTQRLFALAGEATAKMGK